MQKYELTVVLDGKATSAKKKKVQEAIEKIVNLSKGKLGKAEDLGMKDLAYKIKKTATGVFLRFPLELNAAEVKNLSVKLNQETEIIRYLLVKHG